MLARSFCIKHRRHPMQREGLEQAMERPDPRPSPEEASSSQELNRALDAAITGSDRLPLTHPGYHFG